MADITWYFNQNKIMDFESRKFYSEYLGSILNCRWSIEVLYLQEDIFFYLKGIDNDKGKRINVEVKVFLGKVLLRSFTHLFIGCEQRNIFCFITTTPLIFRFKFMCNTAEEKIEHPTPYLNAQITSNKYELCEINKLCQDFQALLSEDKYSDVIIKCKSDAINVHKNILCARSPVFKTMLSCPMQENATNTVTLDEMEPETVRSMIRFMYTGKITINSLSEASSLLNAAEQYQIKSLNVGLVKYLKRILSETNALNILELADLYSECLKADVLKFISVHFCAVKRRDEWESLKKAKPSLALEVYSFNDRLN